MNNPSLNCFYNIKQQKRPKYNITRTPNIIYLFYRYRRIKIISNFFLDLSFHFFREKLYIQIISPNNERFH